MSSEVVDKESRIQGLLEEIGSTKNDLPTPPQLSCESTDQEFQDVKNHRIEFEQKYKMVLEENAKLNQEIGNLSKEAEELGLNLEALKAEVSAGHPLGKWSLFWGFASVYISQNDLLFTFIFSYLTALSQNPRTSTKNNWESRKIKGSGRAEETIRK